MRQWWFITRALNAVFRLLDTETFDIDDDDLEMYVCAVCDSIFLDKKSYLKHFDVDTCIVVKNPLPSEPLELRTD